MKDIELIVVDLFCGFGGTTLGFEESGVAKVIACVNHDPKAIKSHWLNHSSVEHFEEDITTLYGCDKLGVLFVSEKIKKLKRLVDVYRAFYPKAKVILWASLECTNFSKAKGGQPRNADSRTLAEHLKYYIEILDSDYIQIENVVEFMSWGPLDKNGKPISRKNGRDWVRWRNQICTVYNYRDEWREMNSADYGAYTSRNRLFGIFAKPNLPISFPKPTHQKKQKTGDLFGSLEKWKPVKEVLDLNDEGKSIFNRKKPYSERTLERIYQGLLRFATKEKRFSINHKSGHPQSKSKSIEEPSGTITTTPKLNLCSYIVSQNYNNTPQNIDNPSPTITANRKWHYFVNPSYKGNISTVQNPCPVIVARQDKSQLSLMVLESGMLINIESQSETTKKILKFMIENEISDIKMRPFKVKEMLKIQGFPENYKMIGTQEDHKRFIGNSVVPHVVKSWAIELSSKL